MVSKPILLIHNFFKSYLEFCNKAIMYSIIQLFYTIGVSSVQSISGGISCSEWDRVPSTGPGLSCRAHLPPNWLSLTSPETTIRSTWDRHKGWAALMALMGQQHTWVMNGSHARCDARMATGRLAHELRNHTIWRAMQWRSLTRKELVEALTGTVMRRRNAVMEFTWITRICN